MSTGIIIWSKKAVSQKTILLDIVDAAFLSNIGFYRSNFQNFKFSEFQNKENTEIGFFAKTDGHRNMIFYISTINKLESNAYDNEYWVDMKFKHMYGEIIQFSGLYRLAVSDDFDSEATFYFSYNYLKRNKKQIITYCDYLIDWESMKEYKRTGYKINWYLGNNKEE